MRPLDYRIAANEVDELKEQSGGEVEEEKEKEGGAWDIVEQPSKSFSWTCHLVVCSKNEYQKTLKEQSELLEKRRKKCSLVSFHNVFSQLLVQIWLFFASKCPIRPTVPSVHLHSGLIMYHVWYVTRWLTTIYVTGRIKLFWLKIFWCC